MHIEPSTATSTLIQEGAKQIALLQEDTLDAHIAEHIRGMVAATLGSLPVDTADATRNNAAQWQQWALGVADGIELPVAG